jgi:glycosyltransferase involved in cell wall biosynthesis
MSKVKVLVIPSDRFGVGKYRSIDPHIYLQNNYKEDFHIDIEHDPPFDDNFFKNYQMVHFHGFIHRKPDMLTSYTMTSERLKWCKQNGIKTVVDIDDYWMPDQYHPLFHIVKERKDNEYKIKILKEADWVTTTTPIFADEIKKRLGLTNVVVLPNAINEEEGQFQPKPDSSELVRFGWLGGSCYDDETEVLTQNGFKLFKNLKENELVATLNGKGEIEYHKPKGYIKQPFNGKLNCVKSGMIEYAVTPNHNMYVSEIKNLGHKNLNYKLLPSGQVYGKNLHFKRNGIWIASEVDNFELPEYETNIRKKRYEGRTIPMDLWLKFFGFWMAEGWTTKTDGQFQVGVAQTKPNGFLMEIFKTLKDMGFNPTYTKDKKQVRVFNKQLWEYLRQFGNSEDKFIPTEILSLPKKQLETFLEWFINGDGHVENNKYKRVRAFTSSKKLADNLQELALKIGIAATITNRGKRTSYIKGRKITNQHDHLVINFSKHPDNSKHNKLNPLVKTSEHYKKDYNGFVYCVEVENHILYVRKNGKAFWCGNSHLFDIELLREGISSAHYAHKGKIQFVLCGFDLRGTITEINEQGQVHTREIRPKETSWYQYEHFFTDGYRVLPENYRNFLNEFVNETYDDVNLPYRRVWTRAINSYAENYNKFDVSLAPLKDTLFNSVKSQLKVIEAGFHKKPIIASNFGPYALDIINAVEKGGKINPKGNGLLVDINKGHKQWAQHINRLMTSPAMREDLGNALYETVKNRYSLRVVSQKRKDFYLNITK